jgi:hypothetical protein
MITKKNIIVVAMFIACCITVIWFSTATHGGPKTYEIQPRISVPQYKTDAARAIEAYEHLMERYMNMTQISSMRVDRDLKEVIKKLDSIDNKLSELSSRISGIERKLGIGEPKGPENKKLQPEVPQNRAPEELLPIW